MTRQGSATTIVPPVVDEPGLASGIRTDPEQVLAACVRRHGDVFTLAISDRHRITYVLDPHLFHPLLTAPAVDFGPVSRQSKLRFGLGGVVATNQRVRELSHALTGGLRGRQLRATVDAFAAELDRAVAEYAASLHGTSQRTVQHLAQHTLIPATVHALFDREVYDEGFIEDFRAYSSAISTRFAGSDPDLHPVGIAAEKALMGRLAGCLHRTDTPLLASLSQRLPHDGTVTTDQRLRTLLMLLWGSMVNLVPTSVWMYASVVADPQLVDDIRRTWNTDEGMHLRGSVVTETLRLFSRPNIYRQATRDFDLELSNGRTVRFTGGDWIALFPRFLHHDPEVFHRPLCFDARRFCPQEEDPRETPIFCKNGRALRHPIVVFGLGRGRCPGDAYTPAVLDRLLLVWTSVFDGRLESPKLPQAVTDTVSSTPAPASTIDVLLRARREA